MALARPRHLLLNVISHHQPPTKDDFTGHFTRPPVQNFSQIFDEKARQREFSVSLNKKLKHQFPITPQRVY